MPRRSSDSDSDCVISHKKKKSRRRRSSSSSSSSSTSTSSSLSSSSSTTSSSSSSSISSSSRRDRHKKKRHRTRSSSSSHSRERDRPRKRWSPSHSSSRRSSPRHKSERSRSSSYSKLLASRPSRSGSRSRNAWGSRLGPHNARISNRKSRSPKRSKLSYSHSGRGSKLSEDEILKAKLQQALKAAATADAELREKGLLTESKSEAKFSTSNSHTPTFSEQLKRAQAIEEINAPVFTQQEFLANRQSSKSDSQKSSTTDAHVAAIFELSTDKQASPTDPIGVAPIKSLTNWKEKPELLAHENLFEDVGVKMERWKKKLGALRRRKINGDLQMYM